MSRYFKNIQNGNKTIAYGFDKTTGYFFQMFDNTVEDENENTLILDECSTFTNMSNGKMLEFMLRHELDEDHIRQVALDLPF